MQLHMYKKTSAQLIYIKVSYIIKTTLQLTYVKGRCIILTIVEFSTEKCDVDATKKEKDNWIKAEAAPDESHGKDVDNRLLCVSL